MKVALLASSLSLVAPTYVQVDLTPPRMSARVVSIPPLYSNSTVLPSDDLEVVACVESYKKNSNLKNS